MLPWGGSDDGAVGRERPCCRGQAVGWRQRVSGCVPADAEGFLGVLATWLEVWGELPSQQNSFLFLRENRYT